MLNLNTLSQLANMHQSALSAPVKSFELGTHRFNPWPDVSLMGVVNLSSDSWYRESVVLTVEAAVRRGLRLATEGACLIDVGAESTLLAAGRVDASQQTQRLLPVIEQLHAAGVLVSVETYHPSVTQACLQAGAAVINLTAGRDTGVFYRLAAEHGAGVIICYIQEAANVREVADFTRQDDPVTLLYDYFARELEAAVAAGCERIWIDPGLGFYYRNLQDSAVRVRHQMETFLNTFRLRSLGWPVCHALPHAFEYFEEEVRCAEPFFAVMALLGQTDLLRTHEVARVLGVIKTLGVMPS
ncbi:MAG: dihydropteroate synthase [Methylococcaceae bacterium]